MPEKRMKPCHGVLRGLRRPRLTDMHMRHKLLLSLLLVALVPMLLTGSVLIERTRAYVAEKTQASLMESVRVMSGGLAERMQRLTGVLETLTHNEVLLRCFSMPGRRVYEQYIDFAYSVDPLFKNTLAYNPEIKALTIYTDLDVPERSACNKHLSKLSELPWIGSAFESNAAQWHRVDDEFWLVRPLPMQPGYAYVRNLAVLAVDSEWIARTVDSLNGDMDGAYRWEIAGADDNPAANGKGDMSGTGTGMLARESGELDKSARTISRRADIAGTGLTLTYIKPTDSANRELFMVQLLVMLTLIICLMMVIAMSYAFARRLARQIEDLHDKVRTILKEKRVIDLRSSHIDEMGELSNDIHSMVEQIGDLTQNLYRKEIETRELQLRVLKAQINPHFLYNVLSVINWKAIMANADDISRVTSMLAHFYRTTNNKGQEMTTLRNEIQNVRSYIELRLVMQEENFDVVYDLDSDVQSCPIVNMVLQPIVENAIDHGINLRDNGRAKLEIRTRRDGDAVSIEVEDDGVGMTPEAIAACFVEQTAGYGIKNVDERIKLTFGEAYGLRIWSQPGVGTVVRVKVPGCGY